MSQYTTIYEQSDLQHEDHSLPPYDLGYTFKRGFIGPDERETQGRLILIKGFHDVVVITGWMRAVVGLASAAAAAAVLIREAWVPKPLLLVVGAIFTITLGTLQLYQPRSKPRSSTDHRVSRWQMAYLILLILLWIASMSLLIIGYDQEPRLSREEIKANPEIFSRLAKRRGGGGGGGGGGRSSWYPNTAGNIGLISAILGGCSLLFTCIQLFAASVWIGRGKFTERDVKVTYNYFQKEKKVNLEKMDM